jgi:DNA-directed RNA polymerase subunit M/transcription elongation factor TFIIS
MDMRKRSVRLLKGSIPKKVSVDVEIAIFNYTVFSCKNFDEKASYTNSFFCKVYLMKLKETLTNLEDEKFKEDLISSKTPHKLIFKTEFENFHEKFAKYDENTVDDKQDVIYTEMFMCPKCQSNKCSYYEMQTRSSDEAMTSFITCSACNHKWKE